MRNRLWPLFMAGGLFFLAMQWFVAPTQEDREFIAHLTRLCWTLAMVFGLLHIMGGEKK